MLLCDCEVGIKVGEVLRLQVLSIKKMISLKLID